MPEIWLNYGNTDVVLDIMAENLEQEVDSDGKVLEDQEIGRRLEELDLAKPLDLVLLHDSRSVQKAVSVLSAMCEQKSRPPPRILARKGILSQVRAWLPEGGTVNEFDHSAMPDSNLVFVAEVEFDGLFGYQTVSTRLLREFGGDSMLAAYAKRLGNIPAPGQYPQNLEEAKKFADGFEIKAIELIANSEGMMDMRIGHPSETVSAAKTLEMQSIKEVGQHRSMVISTGKDASNDSLNRSLSSLWNCHGAIKNDGMAVLVAQCHGGLGSEALQRFIEGRLAPERLQNPSEYVAGMEDLLFLSEIQKRFQTCLISILPEFYTSKLNMIPLPGITKSLDYILKTRGPREKVTIVKDGARLLLR